MNKNKTPNNSEQEFTQQNFLISRRLIRSIVLQALYAFRQSENSDILIAEKQIYKRINDIYRLFIYQLSFLHYLHKFINETIENAKNKYYPSDEERNPNTRFVDNEFFKFLENNNDFNEKINLFKINWREEREIFRKIYLILKKSPGYNEYLNSDDKSFEKDKNFLVKIYYKYVCENQALFAYYEGMNMFWTDDFDFVNFEIIKLIKNFNPGTCNEHTPLPTLYKEDMLNNDTDKEYIKDLFRKTLLHFDEYNSLIEKTAKNWELERIAIIDMLIIKMALCEMLNFPQIPVKVSLNEYIELSKIFSTPKSSGFINGIMDKIIEVLNKENKIVKTGRGRIE